MSWSDHRTDGWLSEERIGAGLWINPDTGLLETKNAGALTHTPDGENYLNTGPEIVQAPASPIKASIPSLGRVHDMAVAAGDAAEAARVIASARVAPPGGSVVDSNFPLFDGTDGTLLKDSGKAVASFIESHEKHEPNGVATLDPDELLDSDQLPFQSGIATISGGTVTVPCTLAVTGFCSIKVTWAADPGAGSSNLWVDPSTIVDGVSFDIGGGRDVDVWWECWRTP